MRRPRQGVLFALVIISLSAAAPSALAQGRPSKASGPAKTSAPAKTSGPVKLTVKEIVQRESPAIVAISNLDERGEPQSTGTGFIVMAEGVIITNFHVVDGAHDARIKLKNGEIYDRVQVVDYDKRRDIAVLQIRATGLPMVTLGDSEKIDVGDEVVAIGNPKGLEHTVSTGIISARRTDVAGMEGTKVFQTTAPISPGSSGGPLYNERGEVIGITTAQFRGEGMQNLNFAVDFKYAMLMFGHGPGMGMTLAEMTNKEHPQQTRQEPARASQPAPPSSTPSSSGGENVYTEPTNQVTVTVRSGWTAKPGSDVNNGWIMEISKGDMVISVQRRLSETDINAIFQRGEEAILKTAEQNGDPSKVVEGVNNEKRPFKARFYPTKTKSGKSQTIFLGAVATSRTRLLVIAFLPGTIPDADIDDVSNMFLSMR